MAKEPLDPNKIIRLRLLLRRTEETIQNARQEELRKYRITPENAAVLHVISDLGGSAKPLELSRWLSRKQHTVHELLDRMEKANLVEKLSDPLRKKGVRVALTDQGKALHKVTRQLKGPRKIFSALSETELNQLTIFLRKLLDQARKEIGAKDDLVMGPPVISDKSRTRQ
jgi:MarR family transcriptional regulator, organic hydroperoxide resistance regulator